jgi:hypothetical protein
MLEPFVHVVLEVVCSATGHGVLWAVTLGRWKAFQGNDELATLAGVLFWVPVGVGLAVFLLR